MLDLHVKTNPKFGPRANKAHLLQCTETGYVLLDFQKKTLLQSKHVDFIESRVYGDILGKDVIFPEIFESTDGTTIETLASEGGGGTGSTSAVLGKDVSTPAPIGPVVPSTSETSNDIVN